MEIIGELPAKERNSFLERVSVTSLVKEREAGKSLTLLKPEIVEFFIKKKSDVDFAKEITVREELKRQSDLFTRDNLIP